MEIIGATRFTGDGKKERHPAPSPLLPVIVPSNARKCRACGILMPIAGVSAVGKTDSSKCTECAGEGPAPTLPELLVINSQEKTMTGKRKVTEDNGALPEGWGAIEHNAGDPRKPPDQYALIIGHICAEATTEWARLRAPIPFRANRLVRLIKDNYPALEASRKTVSGQVYVYFRLKPQR